MEYHKFLESLANIHLYSLIYWSYIKEKIHNIFVLWWNLTYIWICDWFYQCGSGDPFIPIVKWQENHVHTCLHSTKSDFVIETNLPPVCHQLSQQQFPTWMMNWKIQFISLWYLITIIDQIGLDQNSTTRP